MIRSPWDLLAIPIYWGYVGVLTVRDWLRGQKAASSGFGERRNP